MQPRNVVPEVIRDCGNQLGELGLVILHCFPAGSAERLYGDMLIGIAGAVGESARLNDLAPMTDLMHVMGRWAGTRELPNGKTVGQEVEEEMARADGTNN